MLPPVVPTTDLSHQYREVEYWRITASRKRIFAVNLLGLALLPVWIFLALGVINAMKPSQHSMIINIPSILLATVVTVLLHEGLHGLTVLFFGIKPQFGVLWKELTFYTTMRGVAFKRQVYLIFLLVPLVVLSILFLLSTLSLQDDFWVSLSFMAFILNGAGSIGDLFITGVLLRYPPTAYVVDERDGMRIFLPVD